jgi:hypothetical protein
MGKSTGAEVRLQVDMLRVLWPKLVELQHKTSAAGKSRGLPLETRRETLNGKEISERLWVLRRMNTRAVQPTSRHNLLAFWTYAAGGTKTVPDCAKVA